MANRNFSKLQALNHGLVVMGGNFEIAASGGAATKIQGLGWSVAKTGTGVYTITFEDAFTAYWGVTATLQAAVAVDLVPQVTSHSSQTLKTLVITLLAGATPTEPSAICRVHFTALLRNSSVA